MVAITGFEIGSTILDQIQNWSAPSILADSTMESGTVVLKKVRQMVTLNEEHARGRISAHMVLRRFRILFTTT